MPWRIYAALTREQWHELERLTQRQALLQLERAIAPNHASPLASGE